MKRTITLITLIASGLVSQVQADISDITKHIHLNPFEWNYSWSRPISERSPIRVSSNAPTPELEKKDRTWAGIRHMEYKHEMNHASNAMKKESHAYADVSNFIAHDVQADIEVKTKHMTHLCGNVNVPQADCKKAMADLQVSIDYANRRIQEKDRIAKSFEQAAADYAKAEAKATHFHKVIDAYDREHRLLYPTHVEKNEHKEQKKEKEKPKLSDSLQSNFADYVGNLKSDLACRYTEGDYSLKTNDTISKTVIGLATIGLGLATKKIYNYPKERLLKRIKLPVTGQAPSNTAQTATKAAGTEGSKMTAETSSASAEAAAQPVQPGMFKQMVGAFKSIIA